MIPGSRIAAIGSVRRLRIQLWTSHYAPQPSGIAPLAATIAVALHGRGHQVDVVCAHPYYPERRWGTRYRPYLETRDGLSIRRLPLLGERTSVRGRIAQELSFSAALGAAAPWLGRADAILAISPSFAALGPALATSRLRRIPLVLWLQDILPDGATATGIVKDGAAIRAARRFERLAYSAAARIVVISDSFIENLTAKGVPTGKIARIYNPATRPLGRRVRTGGDASGPVVLTMGNIGHTQNLAEVVGAFEGSGELSALGARFVMAGDGVAGEAVRRRIRTDRVRVTGVLDQAELEREIEAASVALVSQSYATDAVDFNVPSKLMNFMAAGLPVVAAVRPESEVATLVETSGAGWVTDDIGSLGGLLAAALADRDEQIARGERGIEFARSNFMPDALAEQHEAVLEEAIRA